MPKKLLLVFAGLFLGTILLAAEKTVTGNVGEVDLKKNSITVGEVLLDVSRKTKISIDGKKATLAELKKGQKVVVVYDDELDVASSIKAGVNGGDASSTAEEVKKMEGDWVCVASEENGVQLEKDRVKRQNRRLKIKGNTLKMERLIAKQFGTYEGKFEIDPSTNSFDWIGKGPGGNYVEWIGIYELGDDYLKLRFAYQKDGISKRPTSLKTTAPLVPGAHQVYYMLKRDKD